MTLSDLYKKNLDDDEDGEDYNEDGEDVEDDDDVIEDDDDEAPPSQKKAKINE